MRRILGTLSTLAVALPLALSVGACGSSSDPQPPPPPPPPPGPLAFEDFVIDLVQNQTREDGEPVSLDGLEFEFSEDPAAFDVLFENP